MTTYSEFLGGKVAYAPCHVHIVHAESEREVLRTLRAKWAAHEELTAVMTDIIHEHGLSRTSISDALTRSMGVNRCAASGNSWTLANHDCVEETAAMKAASVDLALTSIPFSNHYEYTPSYNDFGHTSDNPHFWAAGSPEYILLLHKPQTDRTRGYADTPVAKDKSDYSRARWQVDAHAFWRSSGQRHLTPDELAGLDHATMNRLFTQQTLRQVYDYESHVRIGEILDGRGALPATFMVLAPGSWHPDVWHDINRMDTLNTEQSRRAQAQHICPLQFDIVERIIRRFSNEGELVFDPFAGLGTVPMKAVEMGRRGYGTELNPDYWRDSVAYLQAAERAHTMPTLFDAVELEEVAG